MNFDKVEFETVREACISIIPLYFVIKLYVFRRILQVGQQ